MIKKTLIGLSMLLTGSMAVMSHAEPFATDEDRAFGEKLWSSLVRAKLAGDNKIMSTPYEGQHPHGAILDTMESVIRIDGEQGPVIVKNNYGGEGVSRSAVANDPSEYLVSVTVMFQRDDYDEDNNNWFWAKYLPDGSFDTNPNDTPLVGRVVKGNKEAGCIACHTGAPGNDLVFINDRY